MYLTVAITYKSEDAFGVRENATLFPGWVDVGLLKRLIGENRVIDLIKRKKLIESEPK